MLKPQAGNSSGGGVAVSSALACAVAVLGIAAIVMLAPASKIIDIFNFIQTPPTHAKKAMLHKFLGAFSEQCRFDRRTSGFAQKQLGRSILELQSGQTGVESSGGG